MNTSSLSAADSPATSSAYQDYLDDVLTPYATYREYVLDAPLDVPTDAGALSPPRASRPPSWSWNLDPHLPSHDTVPTNGYSVMDSLDQPGRSFPGLQLDSAMASAGRPLHTSEGPVGRSSSPLSELFSPTTPPEGSQQALSFQQPEYSANHIARFARIHSFMEARRRESETSAAAAAAVPGGQSPARLATASPLQAQLGAILDDVDSVPPNVNPFMALNQAQPRPSVIRMSPPQNSGSSVMRIDPGQPSNSLPARRHGSIPLQENNRELLIRQEALRRREMVMQQRDRAHNRSQLAIEEYLRNMRSGQRVQAAPPYPQMQRQAIGVTTAFVSQTPIYIRQFPSGPTTNPAPPSPAQPPAEAGPSRSLLARSDSNSPLVTVLHTNPGQALPANQTMHIHRRHRQTIPTLGPQHTAYTPSAEVYSDRAAVIASSSSAAGPSSMESGSPWEVESLLHDNLVRQIPQSSQMDPRVVSRFRRQFSHMNPHPDAPQAVSMEEVAGLSSAERIARRRHERVASTPYERISRYMLPTSDPSSVQREPIQPSQQPIVSMDNAPVSLADYSRMSIMQNNLPFHNTWRQERETRMQADMQQRINAEMHVRERVRAAMDARAYTQSTSHVTVAGERLSVDQQIPTRHVAPSRDLNPYYQQMRNDQESNAERRRRLYYIPQAPMGTPGVHYHRSIPATLLHFMEAGAIFMHHDGEPKLILEQDVISAIAVDTQSFKFDNQFAANEECIICFDEFTLQQEVRVLSCNSTHRFHKECIDKWLIKNKPNCPICRRILPSLNQPKEPVGSMEQEAGPSHTIRPSSSAEAAAAFGTFDFMGDYV